jgi:hypothetical protein
MEQSTFVKKAVIRMFADIGFSGVLYYKDGRKFKGTFSRGQFDGPGEMTVKDQKKNVKKGTFGGCSGLYYIEKDIEQEPLNENSSETNFVGKGTLCFAGIKFSSISYEQLF